MPSSFYSIRYAPSSYTPALPAPSFSSTLCTAAEEMKRNQVHEFARCLRKEVFKFIDDQGTVSKGKERPSVPIWFVKTFNFLKKEAASIDYQSRYLNLIPQSVEMKLREKYGPGPFPEMDENGYIKEEKRTTREEVDAFVEDIVKYAVNGYKAHRNVPILPHSYFITLKTLRNRVMEGGCIQYTKDIVNKFPDYLQFHLEHRLKKEIKYRIKEDFVYECTKEHYEDFIEKYGNSLV